jgi:tetratricopeptide (TPR) repeat protein
VDPTPADTPSSAEARSPLRGLGFASLLALPALALLALHWLWRAEPLWLAAVLKAVAGLADDALLLILMLLGAFVVVLIAWPPLLPRLRMSLGGMWGRMNADRKAIRDLLGRIEHYASPRDLTELAQHYNDAGQHRDALVHLNRALEEGGEDPRTHYEAARALFELGFRPQARAQIELALQKEPELGFGSARLLAAEIAISMGDSEGAEAHARASITDRGESILSLFFLARSLWFQERRNEARDTLRQLLALPKGLGKRRNAKEDWCRARAKLALRTGGRP